MTRFLGGLTVAMAILVALVGVFGIYQAIDDLTGAPSRYSAPTVGLQGEALDLVGARGDELTFYLADDSISGLWGAPRGLRLELASADTGFRTSAEAIAPKEKNWEDPVFFFSTPANRGARNKFEIRGPFKVPDVPGPETQTLTGKLTGEFLYPGTTEDGEHFTTTYLDLGIPAKLTVVSAERADRINSDFRGIRWRRIGLGILYAVIAFGYAISYGTWKDREQTRRWEPYLTLTLGVAVWACFAALWLKPFGA